MSIAHTIVYTIVYTIVVYIPLGIYTTTIISTI